MEKKRSLMMNLAVIGAILLLALAAALLPPLLPERDVTPTAGTLEDAGFTFTPAGTPDTPADEGGDP